ncbi:YicC/YloC family endoribonuclease [Thiohalomonas denitrificans]|uniref:TIGR00255 family protein n=1 Tax=Thiohalomonas denitrificans TaxID=415747 RepID=A0A1G5QTQ3_9GAMM|nr:YicC/YloC family endoribonuclease [Thiohalomonas denitrificans]SCZ64930.1 TIGR00255 family protein [Thiohalomonas denitrificans]
MLRSMTAFARQEIQGNWGALALELRSVNHRYLEIALRLPEEFRAREPAIREQVGKQLGRGKVDVSLRYTPPSGGAELQLNQALAKQLAQFSREVDALIYNASPVSSMEILGWPGVLEAARPDPDQLQERFTALLEEALKELVATREREGDRLESLILQRCDAIEEVLKEVRTRLPELQQRLRERLEQRLAEARAELDEGRLEQELVYFANKLDVDEELDRLDAHIDEVRRVLKEKKPVGRRLDFLMQELNREANTLASKSSDTMVTRASVDLKVYIEQMREQVQNIE